MKKIKTSIPDSGHGLHARPASMFVKLASKFPCEIFVIKEGVEVNGKSIMGLMMLALYPGAEFEICATGEKEEEAIEALNKLIQSDFSE
ncbi:MAG: HPr family phosphocarrier protein [Leptospiraceae bacterium]|nr:HPr family phosphocarrier protein [Leptospiraceae bacterium]MCK6379812.1 HPr family phosphocarrier protein [Leptospiraceae bacterium]NUM41382.1 HPr family phosphocarrier protein [Leptospiraceae bacterium]